MTRAVVLVGLGRIGMTNDVNCSRTVLTHAKALNLSEDFIVEGAVDPDPQARAAFVSRYSGQVYESLSDLPTGVGRDLVVIASPTSTHLQMVTALVGRGAPQAILIEKPMGSNPRECAEIRALCEQHQTRLYVNYHRAVLSSTATIREMISTGKIRSPYSGQALVSGDKLGNGSHMVDLLEDWLGPVSASHVDPFTDGLALEFHGCRVLMTRVRPATFSVFEVVLLAENGRLRFDGWNDRWWWEGLGVDPLTPGYECLDLPSLVVPAGVEVFMASVYAELSEALADRPSSLRGADRALAVQEALDGWV